MHASSGRGRVCTGIWPVHTDHTARAPSDSVGPARPRDPGKHTRAAHHLLHSCQHMHWPPGLLSLGRMCPKETSSATDGHRTHVCAVSQSLSWFGMSSHPCDHYAQSYAAYPYCLSRPTAWLLPQVVVNIATTIITGLPAADILHNDVSLGNIVYDGSQGILLDFGVCGHRFFFCSQTLFPCCFFLRSSF